MEWVTVQEAAARLGTTPDAVRSRLRRGQLVGEKKGNAWYVFFDSDSQATVNDSQTVKPSSRETVGTTGQPTGHRQDTDMTRHDMFDDLLDCDPSIRAAVLEANLRGAQALLRHTETELAATREEAQFLRERLTAQEAIIAQLAEAQSEAQRRRDVLEAQGRAALPEGRKRWWWPFGKA